MHHLPIIKSEADGQYGNQLPATEWAFKHLDEPVDLIESQTYIAAILQTVFSNGSPSNDSTAFTMAVSTLFLDPHSDTVKES